MKEIALIETIVLWISECMASVSVCINAPGGIGANVFQKYVSLHNNANSTHQLIILKPAYQVVCIKVVCRKIQPLMC